MISTLLLLDGTVTAVPVSSLSPSTSSLHTSTKTTNNPSIITLTNSFADETRLDTSHTCITARTLISQWHNVTQCYGPDTTLFYSTPQQVCQGQCLFVTIQAAKYIANACIQTPVKSGFSQSDIYEIWSNEQGATTACKVVPSPSSASSASLNSDSTSDNHNPSSTTDVSMIHPSHSYDSSTSTVASISSTDNNNTELDNSLTYYLIQAVFELYNQWKSVMLSLDSPSSTSSLPPLPTTSDHDHITIKSSNHLLPEQRQELILTQCVDINRQFWSLYVNQQGRQPSLYYWTILEPKEYIEALKELCGPNFF